MLPSPPSNDDGLPDESGSEAASEAAQASPSGPLRDVALKGGSFLAMREAVGMGIRLGGVVVVTRLIGPYDYGIYVGAVAVITFVASVAQLGVEIWLIRQPDEPSVDRYHEAFSALVVVSAVVLVVAFALTWPAQLFLHKHTEVTVFRVLLASVPVNILWAPAQARMERHFDYRRMARLEIGGDLALYGVAVPLALLGFGVWAPVLGYIAWQTTLYIGSSALARLPPRWQWSWDVTRAILRNGITYSSTTWISQVAALANTIIVGSAVGATGVGIVGLAQRLVDTAGFASRAAWRLGLAAISRIIDQPERLRNALEEGMMAQGLMLGMPLAGLAVISTWIIPNLFGSAWAGAPAVYALLALSRLIGSLSLAQMTVLFAQGRNGIVALALTVNVALLMAGGAVFVPLIGVDGFGVATLVSNLAWVLLDRKVRASIGFRYRRCLIVLLALGVPILAPFEPWPWRLAMCVPVVLLAVGDTRRSLLGFARIGIQGLIGQRRSPAAGPG